MLPLKNRLLTKKDFERVKKEGQKFQSRLFGVLIYQTNSGFTRFGFIISTKLSKRATRRNKVKRLLREAVRKFLPRIKPGLDIVFLGKREILFKSLEEITWEVEKILIQTGTLNVKS